MFTTFLDDKGSCNSCSDVTGKPTFFSCEAVGIINMCHVSTQVVWFYIERLFSHPGEVVARKVKVW